MLAKQHRLRQSVRINQVKQAGRSFRNRWLAASVIANCETQSRFAFSVSRRVGNAVTRNQIKRRMRECVRRCLPCVQDGWDVLLIARSQANQATFAQIERAVTDLLQQSGLYRPCAADECQTA